MKVMENIMSQCKGYKQPYKLMLITQLNGTDIDSYLEFIKGCAEGGITSLQLRDKHASMEFLFEFGCKLKSVLAPFNIPLIINDNVELAYKIDADGVHLGQSDGNPKKARKLLGINKIIGLSIESLDKLERVNNLDIEITYIAASAVFATKTKSNIKTVWGIDGLKKVVALSKYPVVAIGGINKKNAAQVINAGASGIAVVSAIHEASNPQKEVQQLCNIINEV
ncbi:thiamine phosphate synthase [Wolbachia endosymbiont of Ctenocephalides felis wCfeT]|uniref:thiamine phosphate synthase n=1 Tax=Wolbachia endosymbiont of Ctenocephalides felis wCfeT TaxID=2732593 RepID=UPI001C5545A0|nr:thiamine phosphate synthase [Wolbachia endosymbiont of Ctenocephalides felis wCfeT]